METKVPAGLTPREGRQFGLTVGTAFGVLGGLWYWRGHVVASVVAFVLGGSLLLGALVAPRQLGPIYRAWMRLGLAISKVTTPIFMSVIFFLVLTPVGIIMRLLGHRPIETKPGALTHWVTKPESERRSNLDRQF